MSHTDITKVKEELVVFLRNSDILTITQRGVTTVAAETFTGTGASQVLTLAKGTVRNIRSLNDGTARTAYNDYTPSYGVATTITGTFASAGANNISVSYDYSTGTVEKIWPDYPFVETAIDSLPRIGLDIISDRTMPIGLGKPNWLSDSLISVKVYDKNTKLIDSYISTIREKILANQILFYYFPVISVKSMGPMLPIEVAKKKCFEKSIDLEGRFRFES